jgi:hypothetical protein
VGRPVTQAALTSSEHQLPKVTDPAPGAAHRNVRATTRKLNAQVLTYFSQHEGDQVRLLRQGLLELQSEKDKYTEQQRHFWQMTRQFLAQDALGFNTAFVSELELCLEEEVRTVVRDSNRRKAPEEASAEPAGRVKLSLVGADEMDNMLRRDEMARRFNQHYEDVLTPLTLRLRSLFDSDQASLQGNPYRPEILVRAFMHALKKCAFEEDVIQAALLAFDPQHTIELAPLYVDLERLLVQAGVTGDTMRLRKTGTGNTDTGPGNAGVTAYPDSGTNRFAGEAGPVPMGSGFPGAMAGHPMAAYGYGYGYGAGFGAAYPTGLARAGGPGLDAGTARGHPQGYGQGYVSGPGFGSALGYGEPVGPTGSMAREFLHQLGLPAYAAMGPGNAASPAAGPVQNVGPGAVLAGTAGVRVPIEAYLLAYLEELQAAAIESFSIRELDIDLDEGLVLHDLREHDEIRRAAELDRGTVDALAEVFDFVLADPNIAAPLKVIIGRLQIPVLKAALLDREFFTSPNHPARRLIDALAAAALAWAPESGQEDPLYVRIESTVRRVLTEFNEDLALFAEALLEFEEFQNAAERKIKLQVKALAIAQARQESLDMARAQADLALQERISSEIQGQDAAAFMLPFLTLQWREVLAQAWLQQAAQPELWDRLLTTTDQLLWSTQPKRDSSERRQLVAVLPALVRQLNLSLDSLDWDSAEREAFTRRLIAAHMAAIRSSPDTSMESQPDLRDLSAREEALATLEQRRIAAQLPAPDECDALTQSFERGMWFDFISDEGVCQRCRLTWVSPKRSRFLFTNREGFDAFVRSEQEVSELLRQGRLGVLRPEPIVTRALEQIMGGPDTGTIA